MEKRLMKLRSLILSVALLGGMLSTTGCSALNVLQDVVDAAAAAIPEIQAAGANVPAQVSTYVSAVANCIASVPGAPAPPLLSLISACLDKQVKPLLPSGLPQGLVAALALVIQDVQNYLASNPPPVIGAPAARTVKTNLSAGDVAKFEALRTKAQATVAALRK
jgi:hypothetical protein